MQSKITTKNIIYLLIVLVIVWLFIRRIYINNIISSCNKYTIATGSKITGGYKSGYSLNYIFKYKKQDFIGSDGDGIDKGDFNKKGGYSYLNRRYFVLFYCNDPSKSKIIWNIQIPDTLHYIPENGWDKTPYGLDKLK